MILLLANTALISVLFSNSLAKLVFSIGVLRHIVLKESYLKRTVLLLLVFGISKTFLFIYSDTPLNIEVSSTLNGVLLIVFSDYLIKNKIIFKGDKVKCRYLWFWFFSALLIFCLILGNRSEVDSNISLAIFNINRNSIAFFLLFIVFFYVLYFSKSRLGETLVFFSCIILFLTMSRASQVASLFLFFVFFIGLKNSNKLYFIILFIPLLSALIFSYSDYFVDKYLYRYLSSGVNSGMSSSRFIMWECLYDQFDVYQLVMGYGNFSNGSCTYLPGIKDPNPHNSIIWSFQVYGFYTILIVVLGLLNLKESFRDKRSFLVYLILFFVVFFERSYMVSIYDIFFIMPYRRILNDRIS